MIHDVTHCSREDCPKKSTCYRYQAWLEIKGTNCLVSMFRPEEVPCKYYMEND